MGENMESTRTKVLVALFIFAFGFMYSKSERPAKNQDITSKVEKTSKKQNKLESLSTAIINAAKTKLGPASSNFNLLPAEESEKTEKSKLKNAEKELSSVNGAKQLKIAKRKCRDYSCVTKEEASNKELVL